MIAQGEDMVGRLVQCKANYWNKDKSVVLFGEVSLYDLFGCLLYWSWLNFGIELEIKKEQVKNWINTSCLVCND